MIIDNMKPLIVCNSVIISFFYNYLLLNAIALLSVKKYDGRLAMTRKKLSLRVNEMNVAISSQRLSLRVNEMNVAISSRSSVIASERSKRGNLICDII